MIQIRKYAQSTFVLSYINDTKDIRRGEIILLISYGKPYHFVSTETIFKWIKCVLKSSGNYTNIFQGHSIRTTSASTANIFGADINTILRAGGWCNEKSFTQFYNKPLHLNDTVSDILLKK